MFVIFFLIFVNSLNIIGVKIRVEKEPSYNTRDVRAPNGMEYGMLAWIQLFIRHWFFKSSKACLAGQLQYSEHQHPSPTVTSSLLFDSNGLNEE